MCNFDKKVEESDEKFEQEILNFCVQLFSSPEMVKKLGERMAIKAKMLGAKGVLIMQFQNSLFIISQHRRTCLDTKIITEHIMAEMKNLAINIDLLMRTITKESKKLHNPLPVRLLEIDDYFKRIIIKNNRKHGGISIPKENRRILLLRKRRQKALSSFYHKMYPNLLHYFQG